MPFSFVHLLTLTGLPVEHDFPPCRTVPLNWMAVPGLGAPPLNTRLYNSPVCESMITRQEFSATFSTQPEPLTSFLSVALANTLAPARHTTANARVLTCFITGGYLLQRMLPMSDGV